MANDIYAKNPYEQAPSGIGPFAPGPIGVISPESQQRLSNYDLALKLQAADRAKLAATMEKTLDSPIDQIVAALKAPKSRNLELRSEPYSAAPIPRDDSIVPTPEAAPAAPEATPTETPTTSPGPQMTKDEQVAVAQRLLEMEADKAAPTPEDKIKLAQKLQEDSGDGMTIGQKMASIAMAVAPTVVGYALHGTKGAYLGAAATGKGLQEGATEMDRQTRLDNETKRADAAANRTEKQAKAAEKKAAFDKRITDEYGNQWFYDENNNLSPVMVNGKQLREANTPISSYNAQTGQQETRMKFEAAPGTPKVQEIPVNVRGAVNDLIGQSTKAGLKGFSVPPEVEAFIAKNPEGTMNDMTPTMRQRFMKVMDDQRALINRQLGDAATQARKPVKAEKAQQVREDTIGRKQQINNLNRFRDTIYAKDIQKIKDMESWSRGGFDTKFENAALYFKGMKEVQQDESVIREGDQKTIESYFSIGTKLGQIESVINNKGKMSDDLKSDILKFLRSSSEFKQNQLATATNNFVNEAARENPKKAEWAMSDMDPTMKANAREFARKKLANAQKLSRQQIADGVVNGTIQNGTMYYDYTGNPFIHQGITYQQTPQGKLRMTNAGAPIRWRIK